MDMLLLAAFFFLSVISIGIPLVISPLTLTGLISLAPLYDLFLIAASTLMLLFTVSLVVTNMTRSEFKHHRGFSGVLVGGVICLVVLGFFGASLIGSFQIKYLWQWAKLPRVTSFNMIWPLSYAFYAAACFWPKRLAAMTLAAGVRLKICDANSRPIPREAPDTTTSSIALRRVGALITPAGL